MFNENLKRLRQALSINQEKLGQLVGANQRTVSAWENAKSEPSIASLKKLSQIFNVSIDDLVL